MATQLLHNATLIDGIGEDPLPEAAVVVDGAKITWPGPRAGLLQSAKDARRIGVGFTAAPKAWR